MVIPIFEDLDDETYSYLKMVLNTAKIPSQVVINKDLENKFKFLNTILGILGKTKNYPYKIVPRDNKIKKIFVGLDISRKTVENYTHNMAGFCKFYLNDGTLYNYSIRKFTTTGETLNKQIIEWIIEKLLDIKKNYNYDLVVIHRDGRVPYEEKIILKNYLKITI